MTDKKKRLNETVINGSRVFVENCKVKTILSKEIGSSYNLIFPDEHLDWGHWVSRYYGLTIHPVSE